MSATRRETHTDRRSPSPIPTVTVGSGISPGSTPGWLPEGRGLRLTAGGESHPAPKTSFFYWFEVYVRAPPRAPPLGGAAVDGERRAGPRLRHLFHLGGHGHRLAVMREPPVLGGGHADRHGQQLELLRVTLAVVDRDVASFDVVAVVQERGLLVEPFAQLRADFLGERRRDDQQEVVSTDVTDERLR